MVPDSSADTEYGEYGALYSFSYSELNDSVIAVTGKSVETWVEEFLDLIDGYTFHLDPDADARFATTRDTVTEGNVCTVTDHTSGYFKGRADVRITGTLPDAGTYVRQDGESLTAFLDRVFKEQAPGRVTEGDIKMDLQLYLDLDSVSRIDLSTGDVTDSRVRLKFAVYEDSVRNIDISTDGRGDDMKSVTVVYGDMHTDNNLFLDLEVVCRIQDLDAFSGAGDRVIRPTITEHVERSIISSDLADSLWQRASASGLDEQLPALILDLIGSGGRMQDLFGTIHSLTGSTVPDATFIDAFDASDETDPNGYHYCNMVAQRAGGPTYRLYSGAYTLDLAHVVSNIPDSLMDPADRTAAEGVLVLLGWSDIDVKDISNNQSVKDQCTEIRTYVDVMIKEDNAESYSTPAEYTAAAVAGILISVVTMALIWRRRP